MATWTLGKDAKIYQGTAGGELSTLTEMSNVRDVTLNLEAAEADVTTRASGGWKATAPAMRQCTCEFEMVWNPDDAGFTAVKSAFLAGTLLELAVLTGAKDAVGSQGPKGSFCITKFDRKESLEEAVTVAVTAKLSEFDEWVSITRQP
jgi:hypothetical protein